MKKVFMMALAAAALTLGSCNGGNKPANDNGSDSTAVDSTVIADSLAAKLTPEVQSTVKNLTAQLQSVLQSKDKTQIISTLANLETVYKNLVEAGNLDEAKSYASAIQQFISQHSDEIKTYTSGNATIASLVNGITNLPTSAATTADEAKAAVVSDVVSLASPAIAKGETAVATAEAAAALVKNAPAAVKTAAENAAKSAVNNVVNSAVSTAEGTATQKAADAASSADAAVQAAKAKTVDKANEQVDKAQKKANEAASKAQQKANDAVNKGLKKVFGN